MTNKAKLKMKKFTNLQRQERTIEPMNERENEKERRVEESKEERNRAKEKRAREQERKG